MNSIVIYSEEDLAPLWNIVKTRFPNQKFSFHENNILEISMQYLDEFCQIFSVWFHNKIVISETRRQLSESFELTKEEESELLQILPNYINKNKNEMIDMIYQRSNIMLGEYRILNLTGFLNFCMKSYRKKMEEIIEACLEEYLIEKDYQEFLSLLQYYVEVEEYQFGELIVIANNEGNYVYYNQFFQNITSQCMNQFYSEFDEENPTADDCLITVLILMLPKRITICGIENISNEKFLKTLKTIFGKRIEFLVGGETTQKL